MKRRLRKKHHVGEFVQLGFEVSFKGTSTLSEQEQAGLLWDFVEQAIEGNDLEAGGGGSNEMCLYVTSAKRNRSATADQCEMVHKWLATDKRIASFEIGELTDAWQESYKAKDGD
jgi:uncharacterized protein